MLEGTIKQRLSYELHISGVAEHFALSFECSPLLCGHSNVKQMGTDASEACPAASPEQHHSLNPRLGIVHVLHGPA